MLFFACWNTALGYVTRQTTADSRPWLNIQEAPVFLEKSVLRFPRRSFGQELNLKIMKKRVDSRKVEQLYTLIRVLIDFWEFCPTSVWLLPQQHPAADALELWGFEAVRWPFVPASAFNFYGKNLKVQAGTRVDLAEAHQDFISNFRRWDPASSGRV